MWNWISKSEELRSKGQTFALLTVTSCTGSTPREIGAKMLVLPSGEFFGTIGGGHLEQLAIEDTKNLLKKGESKTIRYPLGAKAGQCCGGTIDILIESINTGPRLYLFGAGHVGQAVSKVFSGTPFSVHMIDPRPEWIHSSETPSSVIRHACEWQDFVEKAEWDNQKTYVAVMTHRHDTDQEIIASLVKKPIRYLGLIGSEAKWKRFQQRLTARGFESEELTKVKCPIGLRIGGKAPQEVAISLAAELLRDHYGS